MTDEPTLQERIDSLQGQVELQDGMLSFASAQLGRLEQRWRAPGAAVESEMPRLVIEQVSMRTYAAAYDGDEWWPTGCTHPVKILAWQEMPMLPAVDGYKDLS